MTHFYANVETKILMVLNEIRETSLKFPFLLILLLQNSHNQDTIIKNHNKISILSHNTLTTPSNAPLIQ